MVIRLLTVSIEILSSMKSLASETKEIVAALEIAPPLAASLRLQSDNIGRYTYNSLKYNSFDGNTFSRSKNELVHLAFGLKRRALWLSRTNNHQQGSCLPGAVRQASALAPERKDVTDSVPTT